MTAVHHRAATLSPEQCFKRVATLVHRGLSAAELVIPMRALSLEDRAKIDEMLKERDSRKEAR